MQEIRIASTWDGQPLDPAESVTVGLAWELGFLRIQVDAPWHGDPPPDGPPGPTDRLWEHEVVEVFVAGPGQRGRTPYTEVELGPFGHHLVLRLRDVREVEDQGHPLELTVDRTRDRWRATAWVPGDLLPPRPHRVNAYAIHGEGEGRRHLAWQPVPGPAPDFHQPERFKRLDP